MDATAGGETPEQTQARHRKEARELQARVTNKKRNATKKTRKGVNDECDQLERQLKARHADELRGPRPDADVTAPDSEPDNDEAARAAPPPDVVAQLEQQLGTSGLGPADGEATAAAAAGGGPKKRSRQKERLARRAAEQEAAAAAAASEAEGMVDHRAAEQRRMGAAIVAHGLAEHAVAPDGHCLFAAVADQLAQEGLAVSSALGGGAPGEQQQQQQGYRAVRSAAAGYMVRHPDDFAPFLDDGETLESHAAKIRDTAEWGGQLELAALAAAYGVELRVVQDGRLEVVTPPGGVEAKGPLWLAYYRHGYGLGEHYNSLRKKPKIEVP